MAGKTIQKRSHPKIFNLKQIRDGLDDHHIFCEGLKIIQDLSASNIPIKELFCLEGMEEGLETLLGKQKSPPPVHILSKDVMKFVSDVKAPPGIIAIASKPTTPLLDDQIWGMHPLILVLHQIQLPQNMGALIRTAEAAGVHAVWTTTNTADPFSPKAIRGSTGSVFRVSIQKGWKLHEALERLKEMNISVLAASQDGDLNYDEHDWKKPTALVLGSEGSGFTLEEKKYIGNTLKIPMMGHVESLNVGVSGAVCLFEASRQRGKGS